MVATWGRPGYLSAKRFTFSTIASISSSVSVVWSEVSSTLPSKKRFTASVSFSSTFSVMILRTASATSASLILQLYLDSACWYLSIVAALSVCAPLRLSKSLLFITLYLFISIILLQFGVIGMALFVALCLLVKAPLQFGGQVHACLVGQT